MTSGDDYASAAKPQIDWDDKEAREALVDALARDAYACLLVLEGETLDEAVEKAAELLATVTGQDIEHCDDETFRIARKVAKDRVISTVDPEARHGHKTAARSYDGFKGHVAIDPDSEIITATTVTPANTGDAAVAADLIEDLLGEDDVEEGREDEHDEDDEERGDRRRQRPSTATTPTGLESSTRSSTTPTSTRGARPRRPPLPAGCSRRTCFHVDLDKGHRHLPGGGPRHDPPPQRRRRHRLLR